MIPLADGRIVRVRRAPTPDGGWVATHEDITAQERSAQQISYLAFHDGLTELANRAELNKQGEAGAGVERPADQRAADRPRPLQGGQRHLRPRRRRPAAATGRAADARAGPRRRPGGADRRRRIRRASGAVPEPARSGDLAGVATDRGAAAALRPRRQAGLDRRQHRHRGEVAGLGAVRRPDPPGRPGAL